MNTTSDRAHTVSSLAAKWRCSPRQIYTLIDEGALRSFKIGKRGMRISAEEVARWERENAEQSAIETETARLDGARAGPLPTSRMKALANVRG